MEEPEGYKTSDGSVVCKLDKSLYGLKQAPRCWYIKLKSVLKQFGLKPSSSDPCLFLRNKSDLILACFVDDGLIVSKDSKLAEKLIKLMKHNCEVKLEDASYFVGLEIERSKDNLKIHQTRYCESILKKFGYSDCNPVSTPIDPNVVLVKEKSSVPDRNHQEKIGSLLYLSVISRPDICYAISMLSAFISSSSQTHMTTVNRILKYLRGKTSYGINYRKMNGKVQAFSDSDYADDNDSRKSR